MKTNEIIALANAGFTATQITALANAQKNETPTQTMQQLPPSQPTQIDMLNNNMTALMNAMQANAIINSNAPIAKQETTDDILATIINPPITEGV